MSTQPNIRHHEQAPTQQPASTAAPGLLLIWTYPLLIALAEWTLIIAGSVAGFVAYGLITSALVIQRALSPTSSSQHITLALLPAPLIRIFALAMPFNLFPPGYWYGIIALPLLVATLTIARQLRLSRRELGIRPGNLPIQALIAASGLGLGAATHIILRPELAPTSLTANALWFPLVILTLGSLTEEIIFRGVIQAAALRGIGRWAMLYSAMVFSVLQISYQSPAYLLLSFGTGLFFAYSVRLSGSILGVMLAHSLATITLNLLIPNLPLLLSIPPAQIEIWLIEGTGGLALLAFGLMVWQDQRRRRPMKLTVYRRSPGPLSGPTDEHPVQALAPHPDHTLRYLRPIRPIITSEDGLRRISVDQRERAIASVAGIATDIRYVEDRSDLGRRRSAG